MVLNYTQNLQKHHKNVLVFYINNMNTNTQPSKTTKETLQRQLK